ncbi:MAG: transcriptional repressor LexA [Guyparkeria sp.]|uniref:transcriptional repressor LexA n=1 Tax=Guyparkeria sp. TaxID=2035736 RepID=UPI00397DA33F
MTEQEPTPRLTPRQAEILAFIRDTIDETGMPPTRAEINAALGFRSPNAAESHLRALEKKGVIELLGGRSRGIRVLNASRRDELAVVGRIAAGSPILAEEHVETRVPVNPTLFRPRADYLLRVRGMSMKDVGILDGDLIAVHRTEEVTNGQIVVARLADEVTVKRYRRRGAKVQLIPENPEMSPVEIDLRREELIIEGRVVGVLRTLD